MTTPAHYRKFFSEVSGQRVTAQEIADMLGISRNAANGRMNKGLTADDVITISRSLSVNPTMALQELGHLTIDEIFNFMDSDGTLLTTASPEQLLYRLAEETLPLSDRISLGAAAKALADRRDEAVKDSNVHHLPAPGWQEFAVADSSPDHPEEDSDFD